MVAREHASIATARAARYLPSAPHTLPGCYWLTPFLSGTISYHEKTLKRGLLEKLESVPESRLSKRLLEDFNNLTSPNKITRASGTSVVYFNVFPGGDRYQNRNSD